MKDDMIHIGRATCADLEDILALQEENQPQHGGMLSASFGRHLFVEMMREAPLIVARRKGRVIGYLVTGTREQNAGIPIVEAMLALFPVQSDSHIYGPICVKAEERGKGLAQAMFTELERTEPGRRYVCFIRSDNHPSLRAHTKMGMHEIGRFVFHGKDYTVLLSPGFRTG
jgi:predicted GNAT superfamily acetyltransferase